MSDHKCSVCISEAGVKGCICNGAIKLIGAQCLLDHIGDSSVSHNLIDLNLALRTQSDKSLIDFYLGELPKIHDALIYLRFNSTRVMGLKGNLHEDKHKLYAR